MALNPQVIRERLINLFESAPISCSQAIIGIALHLGFTRFSHIFPPKHLFLYHPKLAFKLDQAYRNATSFVVLGATTFEVINRVIGILIYQSAVERRLNGEGDQIKAGRVIKHGPQKYHRDGSKKTTIRWLVTENLFFKVQAAVCAVLLAIETATGAPTSDPETPYSMVVSLEFAMRWLWAFTAEEEAITMFGFIPLKSILLPLFLVTLQRFRSTQAMVKGLVAAVVVSHLLQLKRRDGNSAVPWYINKMQELVQTGGGAFNKKK